MRCLKCLYDEVFGDVVVRKISPSHLDPEIQATKKVYDKNNQYTQTHICVCHTDWFRL